MKISSKFTVLFEEPFWIGIYERVYNGSYQVSRIVFGSEPKDYEVYEFMLKQFNKMKFSSPIRANKKKRKKINPKRLQRKIRKEVGNRGIGTKAQIAMKIQYEANKVGKKKMSKQNKEKNQKRKFELKQQKKKNKHKGH